MFAKKIQLIFFCTIFLSWYFLHNIFQLIFLHNFFSRYFLHNISQLVLWPTKQIFVRAV